MKDSAFVEMNARFNDAGQCISYYMDGQWHDNADRRIAVFNGHPVPWV